MKVLDLLDADQNEEACQAGRDLLEAALERRTPKEREAFWTALDPEHLSV